MITPPSIRFNPLNCNNEDNNEEDDHVFDGLMSIVMTATPVSKEQARETAKTFWEQKSKGRRAATNVMLQEPQLLGNGKDGCPLAYVVNRGHNQGFVLVSGSDADDAVIGYSDEGEIDVQQLPDNMRAWLQAYEATARQLKASGTSRRAAGRVRTKSSIAPLMKSQWDQGAPYYNRTPILKTKTGEDQHAFTGCTITAMAQILYYHQWPKEATKPIPAYTDSPEPDAPKLPALEPYTFDWSKMYPTYKNDENGDEVAQLMLYLGTAAKADYGVESTNASGYNALKGIINYFGYDAGAQVIWRNQKTYDEWVNMLYQELVEKRPVLFSGTTKDGAHSFVVDGYSEEDFFHVNWGWSGQSDGYYRVALMDPKNQGNGGSATDEAYTNHQVAFFGVKPATAEGKVQAARLTILEGKLYYAPPGTEYWDTETEGYEGASDSNGDYTVLPRITTWNFTTVDGTFDMGLRLAKNDGSFSKDYAWEKMNNIKYSIEGQQLDFTGEFFTFNAKEEKMTDGDYKLYFLSKASGEQEWQLDENWDKVYVEIKLDDAHGKMTTKMVTITLSITNKGKGDYHGDLMFQENADGKSWEAGIAADVPAGETRDVKMQWIPKTAGEFNYLVLDNTYLELGKGKVTVNASNVSNIATLTITHRVANATADKKIASKYADLVITATNNSNNDYAGTFFVVTQYKKDNKYVREEDTTTKVAVPAHQTVELNLQSRELTGADSYSFYYVYTYGSSEKMVPESDDDYTILPYYGTYDASGKVTYHPATATVKPEAAVCAIDLREAAGVTTAFDASANPNLLVYVDQNSTMTGNNVVKGQQAEHVLLKDGYPFYAPIEFTAKQISYSRMPDSYLDKDNIKGWSTLVLPFAATSYESADITLMQYSHEDGSILEFQVVEGALKAYRPYLLGVPENDKNGVSLRDKPLTFMADNAQVNATIKSVTTGKYYKMSGTFMPLTDMTDIYVLNAAGSAFVLGTASVQPFRACFMPITDRKDAQLTLTVDADEPTGINSMDDGRSKMVDVNGVWYDLQGRPLSGKPTTKGIYINNARKYVIK